MTDDHRILLEIRETLVQQSLLERERTQLLQAILGLLTKMAQVGQENGDAAVIEALRKLDDGLKKMTEVFGKVTRALETK